MKGVPFPLESPYFYICKKAKKVSIIYNLPSPVGKSKGRVSPVSLSFKGRVREGLVICSGPIYQTLPYVR